MTPAINCLKKANVNHLIHHYDHDPNSRVYGEEAAEKLNISRDRLFKTLIVSVDDKNLSVALVPVSRQLDLKKFVKALGSKKAKMADKNDVQRTTGYILGGVSPFGQKKKLTTLIDRSALTFDTVYVSAGQRGLQIELSPENLGIQTNAKYVDICK
ncbi:MAG: Cys-tRNA(Pro) deacylase [Proteobacteria bacterium]|nr:Cys-tRNA(Pro) deacylase [Pseudomonadota bacterium]MBU1583660.1 Cys-tRNA(Pro) deacylase [Pseudomonadota bacterium]MBU2629720.1 Cys-tRNA(Pro) deacylase [Pseudomonadota bacterium]